MTSPISPPSNSSPTSAPPRIWRRMATFLSIAAVVIGVDQWTKALVRARLELGETWPAGWELIRLTHVENTGAAFGILQGAGGPLIIVGLCLVAVITFVLLTQPSQNRVYTVALSCILGGAIGNLIDRVRLGAVTDFIDPTHYPAFNVADSSIVCGVAALMLLTWFGNSAPSADPIARRDPSEVTS